jgi:hypothetical protein
MVNHRFALSRRRVSDVARQCGDGEPQVCPESARGDESGCPLGERGTTGALWASEEQRVPFGQLKKQADNEEAIAEKSAVFS